METALGAGEVGCARSWLFPVVSPQSPRRCCRGCTLGKRGTGKAWRVAQLLAQIGAGQPQALAQEVPPAWTHGPLCAGWVPWGLASAIVLHWARGWCPFFTHTIPRKSLQGGCPPLNPRVRWVGRGCGLPGLGLQLSGESSPRKCRELSRRIFSYHSASFTYLAS